MKARRWTARLLTWGLLVCGACVEEQKLGQHGPPCASGYSDCGDGTCKPAGTCPRRDSGADATAAPDGPSRDDGADATASPDGPSRDSGNDATAAPDGPSRDSGNDATAAPDGPSRDSGNDATTAPDGPSRDTTAIGTIEVGKPVHVSMSSRVSSVMWNAQGTRAYVAGESKIHVLDMQTLSVVSILPYQGSHVQAMIEDGRQFLTMDFGRATMFIENVESGTRESILSCGFITGAALSHDRTKAAASGSNDRAVCFRDLAQPPESQVKLAPVDKSFLGVAFSDDDALLYGHDGDFLDVFDVASLKVVRRIATPTAAESRGLGAFVLVPQRDAILQLTRTGAAVVALDGSRMDRVNLDYSGIGVTASRDGKLGVVSTLTYDPNMGSLWLIDLDTLTPTKLFTSEEEKDFIETGFISPDGAYIIATYYYGEAVDVYRVR